MGYGKEVQIFKKEGWMISPEIPSRFCVSKRRYYKDGYIYEKIVYINNCQYQMPPYSLTNVCNRYIMLMCIRLSSWAT